MTKTAKRMGAIAATVLTWALPTTVAEAAEFANTPCGYSVTYPDGWNVLIDPDTHSLNLANVPWEQLTGMSFPPGVAQISIEVFGPPYNAILRRGDDDAAIFDRLITPNTTVISRSSAQGGRPARIVMSTSVHRTVITILHKGAKNFYISLSCGPDDLSCPGYEQLLDGVIASLTLTMPTPSPGCLAP